MFLLKPVTLTDPYSGEMVSAWAAEPSFFDYFRLDKEDMSIDWSKDARWSLKKDEHKSFQEYLLLQRGVVWAEMYKSGGVPGLVLSDDLMFLEELIVGLNVNLNIEILSKVHFDHGDQDVMEVAIHPQLIT